MALLLLLNQTLSAVDSYQWRTCWNLKITDPTYFWYGTINWSISETVYQELATRDALARADYKALITKWRTVGEGGNGTEPASDWISIAQPFYWAYRIPSWDGVGSEQVGIWEFECDLFTQRWSSEDYGKYWSNQSSSANCSDAFILDPILSLLQVAGLITAILFVI